MEYDYSKYYNTQSGADDAASLLMAKRYIDMLTPYLPNDKTANILEIGPGNGLTLRLLAERGFTAAIGMEADGSLAKQAIEQGLQVDHIAGPDIIKTLVSSPDHYDLVFCMHVIEHIPKDAQLPFVRAINKSLRSGGHLLCETPNALGPVANYFRYNDWTHTSCFTPTSLKFLFECSGFQVLYTGASLEGYPPPTSGLFWKIFKRAAEKALKFVSFSICRIHYVAEFGFAGLNLPLTKFIVIAGKKE